MIKIFEIVSNVVEKLVGVRNYCSFLFFEVARERLIIILLLNFNTIINRRVFLLVSDRIEKQLYILKLYNI